MTLDALPSPIVLTERISPERLEYELGKVDDPRDPPVPVVAWLALDSQDRAALLLGWAENLNGANDGWRGLVRTEREYAPGFLGGVPWLGACRGDPPGRHLKRRSAPGAGFSTRGRCYMITYPTGNALIPDVSTGRSAFQYPLPMERGDRRSGVQRRSGRLAR